MTITPDDKDWTWVLTRPCPECGIDVSGIPRDDTAPLLRRMTDAWVAVLADTDRDLAARPAPDRWSPLEYACHVRDVFRVYTDRLARMRTEDDPLYANWDQDATAVGDRYGEQDPATVATELRDTGTRLADAFATVTGGEWDRPGRRSDGADFTIESFARYFLHDPLHHLWDVGRPFGSVVRTG
jgi:hypothetical protein